MLHITVIVDNTPNSDIPELESEHGLSMLIECDGKKILCDTGKSDLFAKNAEVLGISLGAVNAAFMSHGHNDHTGGLRKFLETNADAPVYASSDIFGHRFFSSRHANKRDISSDENLKDEYRNRFVYVDENRWISDNIAIVKNSCSRFDKPVGNLHLTSATNGCETRDDFCHELALVFKTEKGLVIVSSCSHNGAMNIIKSCMDFTGEKRVCAFVGGLHFVDCNKTEREVATFNSDTAEEVPDTVFYTGHCTSDKAKDFLRQNKNVKFFRTGSIIEI